MRGAAAVAAASAPRCKLESLGTTFGGGPLACAAIEAVIEAIETEQLLERVRRIGAYIRAQLRGRPGHRLPGRRAAGRPAHLRVRPRRSSAELLECGILAGTATDPHVLRLLPPYILEEQHVDMLRDALRDLPA